MEAAARYAEVLEVAEREGVDGRVRLVDGRALVPELAVLERMLLSVARSGPGDAAPAARHLLEAGGKRLRPMLLFLVARLFGHEPRGLPELGAVAELAHSATLLHDDVIDMGEERRHQPTSRTIWGNAVSVLAGDFLLTRALSLCHEAGSPVAMGKLLRTMERMVAAEIRQLALRGRADATEADYWQVVDGKTASLFEWCAEVGALAGGATPGQAATAARYARELGIAFQVVDDLIDFQGSADVAGKSTLRDLAEGKLTLPVLRALERRPELRARVARGEGDEELGRALQATGAGLSVQHEVDARLEAAFDALFQLPEGPYRFALETLSRAAVAREA